MVRNHIADRRSLLRQGIGAAATLLLGGCEPLSEKPWVLRTLGVAEEVSLKAHRLLIPRDRLAPEFSAAEISAQFKVNGSDSPDDERYQELAQANFADWRLIVDGLFENPAEFSLPQLREMPARIQITRHECVEGWSCIGKWKGVPLAEVLERAKLKPEAKFIVFYCANALDPFSNDLYYESLDLVDAFHPQTILAYEMNDWPLSIPHGGPIRLRAERQLGYKMAKFVMRIEAVAAFDQIGQGKGGYWEDRGYDWYAGI
jgi:DMSO/TMAO reductase YedYZ molybdopterin-dependent catalytic subunit